MSLFKKFAFLGSNQNQAFNTDQIVNNQEQIENDFLSKVTYSDVDFFHLKGIQKWAKVVRMYDADSPTLIFFINGRPHKWRCRLARIDTAEKTSKDPAEVEHSLKAIERLKELVNDKLIWVKIGRMDKYHRPLVELFSCPDSDQCFNDILVGEGFAYNYDGGKRRPFREWSLERFSAGVEPVTDLKPVDNIQDGEIIEADDKADEQVEKADFKPSTNVEEVFRLQ